MATALLPLLSYFYLPWTAQNRVGQTWFFADTDWHTFWFVTLAQEWWELITIPSTPRTWFEAWQALFYQQAEQITAVGVILGIMGLIVSRRYLWLFGPPFLTLVFFILSIFKLTVYVNSY